jgi:hypothetical protein
MAADSDLRSAEMAGKRIVRKNVRGSVVKPKSVCLHLNRRLDHRNETSVCTGCGATFPIFG